MAGIIVFNSFTFSWGRKEVQMIIIQCEEWLLENYAQSHEDFREGFMEEGKLE